MFRVRRSIRSCCDCIKSFRATWIDCKSLWYGGEKEYMTFINKIGSRESMIIAQHGLNYWCLLVMLSVRFKDKIHGMRIFPYRYNHDLCSRNIF